MKIDFEITSFGLDQLLKQKLGCSFFFVWLANGLCGRKTSINVAKGEVTDFVGKINGAIKTIYSHYKSKVESHWGNYLDWDKGFFWELYENI